MPEALDEILSRLKQSSKRLTPQRRRIIEVILQSNEHLDVEQIRSRCSRGTDRISYATVYRTMRMLVDSGIIKERHFKDGSARYEYVEDGDHHDHLICTDCGDVSEFTDDTIERLQEVVAREHGFEMTGHRHEIYGLCAPCRIRQNGSPRHERGRSQER